MKEQLNTPTTAYDLLEHYERQVVDDYVNFAIQRQYHSRQRIALALDIPIPGDHVRRSKGVLARPLAKAAVAEKLKAAADEEDLSPDRVIKEHATIAFSNIFDYIEKQNFGDFTVKNLDQIPRALMAAVKSIKSIPTLYGMRTEVTLHDKHPSLKVLTELMGLVAPDSPPPLAEYSKPKRLDKDMNQAPETAYANLLEAARVNG